MTETLYPQLRAEWPGAARRIRGRRESKVAYRNNPAYATLNARETPLYASSPPEQANPRSQDHFYIQQQPNEQSFTTTYYNLPHPSDEGAHPYPVAHQQSPPTRPWISPSPSLYTLAPTSPVSPHSFGGNPDQPLHTGFSPMSNNGQDASWFGVNPSHAGSDIEEFPVSEMNFGSFGSFDGLGLSSGDTNRSSISGDYVFPVAGAGFEPPQATTQLQDLNLTGDYYEIGSMYKQSPAGPMGTSSSISQDMFKLENQFMPVSTTFSYGNVYTTSGGPTSSAGFVGSLPAAVGMDEESMIIPWNSQLAQASAFQINANAGVVTFEPPRGSPYDTFIERQLFLDTTPANVLYGPEGVSPEVESENDSWVIASYPSSEAASGASPTSPQSHNSPTSQPPSPSRRGSDILHSHMYSSMVHKSKLPRGRQRGLTALEKKQARDVREAKACWACHISKTKCSPCSPGKPCEQCARLAGKRRFCLFDCFNEPLESLTTFMIPEYSMGHFTRSNLEGFVNRNAVAWGTQSLVVRMDWGYRRLLEAEVVALVLRSDSSEMRFQHQTHTDKNGNKTLVTKESPPLGIPLAAMDDMQDDYSRYVQDIVQNDIVAYIAVPYDDERSMLPERLLGAISRYYAAGRESGNEVDLLRRALEMHVTMTIIKRSLILDEDSLSRVQSHLGMQYPEESAPRCAQRQIKLAFFLVQQRRIMRILKDWGSMMWATNNNPNKDREWAVAFSVFIVLILVVDNTLSAAYYYSEGRIKNYREEANIHRNKFEELVRLTEKELFDRCKEIFHWKFKTRKGGKEACNPIRDGLDAFQKSRTLDDSVTSLVWDLQRTVGDFDHEIRSSRSPREREKAYSSAGRLACIFLDDFMNR